MANYTVDIAVALKGAQKLTSFSKRLKETADQSALLNKTLKAATKDNDLLIKSFDNLNKVLSTAKTNFNSAASGTKLQEKAARQLILAEKELNKELKQREKLLKRISTKPLPLPGSGVGSDPIAKSIARRRKKLSRGANQFKEPIGPVQASQLEMIPGFGMGSLQGQSSPVADKIAKALENEKKFVKEVEAIRGKASKKRAANTKRQLALEKKSNAFVKKAIKEEAALRKKAEKDANLLATKRRARRQKLGSTISSAAIGGAFPLLFGQTGAAAVGGGLGGLAGGAIGGQFGFALSIVGTAIGSAIDKNEKFNESLAVLNSRFSRVSGGSQLVAKDIDDLAKRFRVTKEEAFGLLEGFKEFDNPRLRKSLVEVFGSDSSAFQSLAGSNRSAQLAKEIFEARKDIGDQQTTQLLQQNLINNSETLELALIRAKIKARQRDQLEQAKQVKFLDKIRGTKDTTGGSLIGDLPGIGVESIVDKRVKALEKKFAETEDQTLKDTIEGLKILREQLSLVNEAQGQFGQSGVLAFSAINDKVKDLQDEMLKLKNPINQVLNLSQAMAQSFESSFAGIIKGTMSVQDAFRNMLNAMADHFIKTAARMAANQFQQSLLGMLGKSFAPKLPLQVNDIQNKIGTAADGGRIPGGKPTLVGERGPELFTPGVSGMVTPNHALGGSTNVVVNVDASGSNVEGDEQGGRELGRLISAAVQSEIVQQQRPGGLLA